MARKRTTTNGVAEKSPLVKASADAGPVVGGGVLTVDAPTIAPPRAAQKSPTKADLPADANALIQSYPGPAVLVSPTGAVLMSNEHARDLSAALQERALGDLAQCFSEVIATRRGVTEPITLPTAFGAAAIDVSVVPIDAADGTITALALLGRNVTLENNLRNALVESRQRYKDLVECSSDFAWETGSDGRFVFVSPKGVLGFHPDQLIGRPARDFIVRDVEQPEQMPFDSDHSVESAVVWMRAADGTAACLKVSSLPLFGPDGAWNGSRGISRDITSNRAMDLALAVARRREQTLDSILRAMGTELEPRAMLNAATGAIFDALDLATCWIVRLDDQGQPYIAASNPDGAEAPKDMLTDVAKLGPHPDPSQVPTHEIGSALLAATQYAKTVNGAVVVSRGVQAGWSEDDRHLLAGVAGQLGIAIEQVANHEQLEILSRTDGLTGLLNRRAFLDEVERRLRQAVRNNRPATLLYIDLDNFKSVNDAHGHGVGDAALQTVSTLLAGSSRGGDILARMGGDEFAVWLDETELTGGLAKAKAMVTDEALRASVPAVKDHPFGLSIGVAAFDPKSGESLDRLIERADRAMYQAKRDHGDSSYHVAPDASGKPEA